MGTDRTAWDIVKSIISEEVVPKDECRSDCRASKVSVPFFEQGYYLIALFSDIFFREEKELSLAVNEYQGVSPLPDKGVSVNIVDELKQFL